MCLNTIELYYLCIFSILAKFQTQSNFNNCVINQMLERGKKRDQTPTMTKSEVLYELRSQKCACHYS